MRKSVDELTEAVKAAERNIQDYISGQVTLLRIEHPGIDFEVKVKPVFVDNLIANEPRITAFHEVAIIMQQRT